MIIIREVFTAKPGMASKLAKLFKDMGMGPNVRVMTDMVGDFNTVVIESEFEDFAAMQRRMQEDGNNQEMRQRMSGYTDMYQTGRREIYQIW
jgi:hypothetical protein